MGGFASCRATVALLTVVGCADTATVGRSDGPDIEARIQRSDTEALYVRSSNGQIYRAERKNVTDVDHPGNVLGWVGLSLIGVSTLFLAETSNADPETRRGIAAVYGVPGVLMALAGWYSYFRSVNAARTFESAEVPAMLLRPAQIAPVPSVSPLSNVTERPLPAASRPSLSDGRTGQPQTGGDASVPLRD
jgi:hypothetical protein